MRTAKRTGIAALFAVFFALLLAGCLCLGLPAKREAQAAEGLPSGAPAGTVAGVVQTPGGEEKFFDTLGDAFVDAQDGATINIYRDEITDSSDKAYSSGVAWLLVKNKSLTVNGNGCTLTATSVSYPLYYRNSYEGTEDSYKLVINNLTIVGKDNAVYGILLYGERLALELNNSTLDTSESTQKYPNNPSALCISGRADETANVTNAKDVMVDVDISGSTLKTSSSGRVIKAENPVNLTIKEKSTLSGWSAIYMRPLIPATQAGAIPNRGTEYSTITISDSTILTMSKHNGGDNMFGAIVFENGKITLNINNSDIVAETAGTALQYVIYYSGYYYGSDPKTNNVNFNNTDVTLTGSAMGFVGSDSGLTASDLNVKASGGAFNFEVPDGYLAEGMDVYEVDGKYLVGDQSAVAFVMETSKGYTSLQDAIDAAGDKGTVTLLKDAAESVTIEKGKNITIDLNGNTITNTADEDTITNYGTLTIIDSGENGTVDNVSHGRSAVFNEAGATAYLNDGTFTRSAEASTDFNNNGENSYYVILNQGTMTIGTEAGTPEIRFPEGKGYYSSLVENGWYTASQNTNGATAKLTVFNGTFVGGKHSLKNVSYGELVIKNANVSGAGSCAILNWNDLTVNGGTFNATGKDGKAFLEIDTVEKADAAPSEGVTASITGGAFDASVEARNITGFIKGGAFSEMPKMDYFAENYIAQFNAETGKYETKEGSWVAAIGEEGYATLQDAINAAENGDTIILRADVTLTEALTIDKSVTIDLAGHTINAPATAANITADATIKSSVTGGTIKHTVEGKDHGLIVTNDATLTLESVTVDYEGAGQAIRLGDYNSGTPTANGGNAVLESVTVTGGIAGVAMFGTAADFANGTSLTATDSIISGTVYYGIATNGLFHNNTITLTGTDVSAPEESGTAMYLPGEGETTITGGTITGATGIEIRAGKLTINEGTTIIATGDYEEPVANPDGTTVGGVAVAVSQHTTQLAINVAITGGTFNATGKDGKAFLEIDTVEKADAAPSEGVTASITGGAFDASVEARNITGFIEGGDFGVKPADKLMNEGYAAEYVNGRYVAVPSTALQEARLAAQADVRAYAATMGFVWSDIVAEAADESAAKAQRVLATYNAIAEAMSTLAVAEAKLDAMAALDLYDAAAAAALAETKQDYIDDLKKLAAGDEATDEDDIILPTATYFAINSAATAEEALFYYKNAKDEIDDISAYRGEIAAQAKELKALKAAIAAIDGDLFGTEDAQGAIKDIQDAIAAAQNAITNGDETTSASLKQIYDYLNGTLKGAVDGISRMLTDAVSEGGILYEMQETLEALNSTVNGDDTEGSALLDKLTAAIEAAQNAINGNTATEMDGAVEKITAAITAAQNAIIAALADYKETLTDIAGSVEALEELLGGTNGLAAIKKGIDDALAAIGTADGETLFEQLAAIESGNTAIKTTVDELAAALTGTDGAIATLTAALTAMQGDITELTGALAEDTGWVAKDIAAAQAEIDKLTAAVGKLGTVDGKDLAAVVGEIADGLEEMDATVNSIASTVSAASAVEEAKTQAAADIRTWLEGYLEELAGDTAQADVLARAAYTAETTEGELYKDISAQFGEENGKLVLKYYNEALAAIDAATTVSDVTTAVATFRAQVASIEASAGNSTDLTVVYVLLGVVLLVLIIACIVALVKGGRQPEPAPAQAAPAEKPAEAQPEEKAEEKEEQAEEAAPAEEPAEEPAGEMAPAEEESAAAEDDDKERVVISANVRTFDEAYEDLTDEQRELFNKVKEYALAKEDAVEVKQSGGVVIKRKSKQIVKLTVRRDMPVALFLLENEMLKDFRRNAKSEAKLKVRATELVIREADDLETAYTMVDLSVEQIEKDLEAAKERRREARRQRRLQRQAEEAAAEQAEGAEERALAESAATDGTDTE